MRSLNFRVFGSLVLRVGAFAYFLYAGQIISQSLHARPDVFSTGEGPPEDDDSYLGYSVTVGNFGGGSGSFNDVAVGMPRGAGLLGKIVMFTWNVTNIQNITGEQLGSYFGYALATSDVDGDGHDDIIIGAPLYTDLNNNEGHFETGRIYIIYQGVPESQKFRQLHTRDGTISRSRFGLALTTLGDINKDGFGDFAVGAPYDGIGGRGAVYIYHGSAQGCHKKASQIIRSEDVGGYPTTFGFSLSGGFDLDENKYSDLVVGAYESDTAIFYRARPVVELEASLSFGRSSKIISLEEKNCTLKDFTKVPCVSLETCLEFTGEGIDRRLEFDTQILLDTKKPKHPRMFFLSNEGRSALNQSLRLDKGKKLCKTMFVYLKPNIRDKLTSLEAEMRYSLKGSEISTTRRGNKPLTPILNLDQELFRKDFITIRKNCGQDNICIPDLRLIATPSVKRYLLGSGERLYIDVIVQNQGEDSFESSFDLQIPPGLHYVRIERVDGTDREIPIQCSAPTFLNNNTVHCEIGNPLPKERLVHFRVLLQPYHKEGMSSRYEFHLTVNSTNPENASSVSDNVKHITVPIWVETDLIIQGTSQPSEVHYNISLYRVENITKESEIGPHIAHIYSIRNKGPSDIIEAEAQFLWPAYTLGGDHLLYLLEQPETNGNIKCEYVEDVNPEHILLDRNRKSFFDKTNILTTQSGLTGEKTAGSTSSSTSSTSSTSSVNVTSTNTTTIIAGGKKISVSSEGRFETGSEGHKHELTAEEKRKWEEIVRMKEEEEAKKETGDSSYWLEERKRQQESTSIPRGKPGGSTVESSRGETITSSGTVHHGPNASGSSRPSIHGTTNNRDQHMNQSRFEEKHTTWTSSGSSTHGQAGTSGTIKPESKWVITSSGKDGGVVISSNEGGSLNLADLGLSSSSNSQLYTIDVPTRNRTYHEERTFEKNQTWNSVNGLQPKISESSSWHINRDGVITSGSNFSRNDVSGGNRNTQNNREGFNRESVNQGNQGISSNRNEIYIEERHRPYNQDQLGGRPITDVREESYFEERNRGRGSTSGNRDNTFYEERNRNRDKGSPSSNREEGYFDERNRFHSNRGGYTGDRLDEKHRTNDHSHRVSTDVTNQGRSRNRNGTTYSEEVYREKNTTWSTGDEKPLVSEHERWNIDRDGNIRNSSSSRVYEGADLDYSGNKFRGGVDRNLIAGSTDGSKVYSEDKEHYYNTTWRHGSKPITHTSNTWRINEDGNIRNGSSSNAFEGTYSGEGHSTRHGHIGDRRGGSSYSVGGSRQNTATNINVGDLTGSNRQAGGSSSSFDFSNVAVGPRDGKARTYTVDLGIDSENQDHGSSTSRHYSSGNEGDQRLSGGNYGSETHYSTSRVSGGGVINRPEYDPDLGIVRQSGSGSSTSWSSRGVGGSGSSGYSAKHDENLGNSGYSRHYSSSSSSHWNSEGESSRSTGNEGDQGYRWSYSSSSDSTPSRSYSGRSKRSVQHIGPRFKRQAQGNLDNSLICGPTKCIRIRCSIGPLKKDQEAWIAFRSRIWLQTMKKISGDQEVNISSMVGAKVTQLPHIGPPDDALMHIMEVSSKVSPRDTTVPPEIVPLWVVVVSACAGALILMLLIFLLYKCGFFKRNRPSTSPEKQPLNRNGHYQPGDEQL